MPFHICPLCGAPHEVSPVRERFAYGHQLTCSPHCKTAFAKLVRGHNRCLQEMQERRKFIPSRDEEN